SRQHPMRSMPPPIAIPNLVAVPLRSAPTPPRKQAGGSTALSLAVSRGVPGQADAGQSAGKQPLKPRNVVNRIGVVKGLTRGARLRVRDAGWGGSIDSPHRAHGRGLQRKTAF